MAVRDAVAEASIVRLAATGDEVAFAQLVADHHVAMARVAYVICGDQEATRDAVQSAWTIAWRRIGSLRDAAAVRPWLIAIAANEARKVAGRSRRAAVVDISSVVAAETASPEPRDTVETIDLERALRGLRPEERSLLAMRFAAGLDSPEIARHIGMSASGVRSRLARIIDRLRADLATTSESGK